MDVLKIVRQKKKQTSYTTIMMVLTSTHEALTALSVESGIPLAKITGQLVDFALAHVTLVDQNDKSV